MDQLLDEWGLEHIVAPFKAAGISLSDFPTLKLDVYFFEKLEGWRKINSEPQINQRVAKWSAGSLPSFDFENCSLTTSIIDPQNFDTLPGIRLNYSGKGTVRWSEGSGKNRRTYTNKESYLDLQQLVCGSYDDESELAEGQYVFVFNCELPKNSPCSYEGDYGRIKYFVKATMDLPWKIDPISKKPLTVVSIMDLNRLPVAAAPVSEQSSKIFWGQSKPLSMSFDLPVRGYVAGQLIPIKVLLNNESEVEVKRVSAELHQNAMFHATSKSRPSKVLISRIEVPVRVCLGRKEGFLRIKVPALPPSYLEFCNIIDLRYHLTITAEVSGLHMDLACSTEILLGNIPLMAYQRPVVHHQMLPKPVDPENPSHSQSSNYRPPPYNVGLPLSTMYDDLPPPTYEQSIRFGQDKPSDDSDSDADVQKFASLYPVYKFDPIKE